MQLRIFFYYANNSFGPHSDADTSKGRPPTVSAEQHPDSFPFPSARLTRDCQPLDTLFVALKRDKVYSFIVKSQTRLKMEKNLNTVQEEPVRTVIPELPEAAVPEPELPEEYGGQSAKAARIAAVLAELLDPAYVLLFGRMAGRTPHSDTLAYDLLLITDEKPCYDWYDARRYLKMKMPWVGHGAPYVNLYMYTRQEVESHRTPFFYLALKEGVLLYSAHGRLFKRPKGRFDFGSAAAEAGKYAETFLLPADRLAAYAGDCLGWEHARESAFAMAQAAVYYFRTLFYVYHGFEADSCDVMRLHLRLRTLSGEFPLLFESGEHHPIRTLQRLNGFMTDARYDPRFCVGPGEMAEHLERVRRLGKVVTELCRARIALYDERAR